MKEMWRTEIVDRTVEVSLFFKILIAAVLEQLFLNESRKNKVGGISIQAAGWPALSLCMETSYWSETSHKPNVSLRRSNILS